MAWARRIVLFLSVNTAIVLTISVLTNILGIRPYLVDNGLDISSLAAFCALWGFSGAFISLLISRAVAKWTMGVKVIDPSSTNPNERALLELVYKLSAGAGLPKMPEVGIYESPEVNAFATGPSKSKALVAVSTGLLANMRGNEVAAVIGHEISHVANGDMVTMTLIQGVINSFVMFLSRLLAFLLTIAGRSDRDDRSPGFVYYAVQIFLELVLTLLGSIIVAAFSRWREYRADAGGAKLAGKENMIEALERLKQTVGVQDPRGQALKTLQISGTGGGFLQLFSSHPPLEERIKRLQANS